MEQEEFNVVNSKKALRAKENRDLTKGNLFKKLIIYVVPLFLANALSLLFTTMDLFTVARFGGGNISSGAIGACSSLINLVLAFFWGLTNGASVIVGNAKGAKDYDKCTRAIGTSVLLTIFLGVIIMILGAIFAKPLLQLLQTPDQFLDKSTLYLTIYFIGTPFNLLFNIGASVLRALGDSKRPLVAVTVAGVINVGLNFLLVIPFKMDVMGVAIATVASQAISMFIVFLFLMKDKKLASNFHFKYLRYNKEEAKDIIRIGLASGLQSLIFNITNVLIQVSVNGLSDAAVVGKAAGSNVEGYEYALLNAISNGCTVATSQNYGAKDKKRVKHSLRNSIIFELIAVTAFDGIILALANPILRIFIAPGEATSQEATQYAIQMLMIMGLPYALCGIAECFTGYLRGMKYSLVPTLVSLICIVGVRLIYIYAMFPLEQFHSFSGLMWTYPVSWTLCCLVYIPISIVLSKRKFKEIDKQKQELSPAL